MRWMLKKLKHHKKSGFRYISFFLVSLFLISIAPVSALVVHSAIAAAEDDAITSFEEPMTQVTGSIGTEASDLPLPPSLVANMEDGSSRSIPVVWDDGGLYDKNTAGAYTFTADIGAYTYAQPHPVVVVTLSESENTQSSDGIILSFDELDSMYAEELAVALGIDLADLSLPTELGAMVERSGLAASENISVTWASDPDYDNSVIGNYLLTPVLTDGYMLADGVSLPQITIEVKDSSGLIQPFVGGSFDITGKDEATIENTITALLKVYDPLIINGTKTNVSAPITLTIPSGKTLVWNAAYESMTSFSGGMINLSNLGGTFQVISNGSITSKGGGSALNATGVNGHIEINGGQISTLAGGGNPAIYTNGSHVMVAVGGSVTAQNAPAIWAITSVATEITVSSGGTVHSASSTAIQAMGSSSQITVSGTGAVTANGTRNTIETNGSVTIEGGEVSSSNAMGIYATGATSTVTVNSTGAVTSLGSGYEASAIRATGQNAQIVVDDAGTVSAVGGVTIYATGSNSKITAGGNSTVSGASAGAINSNGNIEMKGNSKVTALNGATVSAYGGSNTSVTVKDHAVVEHTGNSTVIILGAAGPSLTVSGGSISCGRNNSIANNGNGSVTIEGTGKVTTEAPTSASSTIRSVGPVVVGGNGVVMNQGGGAAIFHSGSGTVDIKGSAEVSAGDHYAVVGDNGTVSVSESALVECTGTGTAIKAGNIKVSGGKVLAKQGYALDGGQIEVSGGLTFAYGSEIIGAGNVVHSSGTFTVTGEGVVIGWDAAQGVRKYLEYRETHISRETSPETADTAEAYWDYGPSPDEFTDGIAYKNGSNTGFIELPVELIDVVLVTVSKEISGAYANMQGLFDFKLTFFTDDSGTPVTTTPTFTFTGGTLTETGASAPEDGFITLDGDGSATIRLGHGQKITLEIPRGYYLEIQEILEEDSQYTPSIQLTVGSVETNLPSNTTELQEINDDTTVAYANAFEAIVPTDITSGVDTGLILLFSAAFLVFAIAVPTVIRRYRRR